MKTRNSFLNLSILALVLVSQMAFVVPTVQASQHENHTSTTTTTTTTRRVNTQRTSRCRTRCNRDYRLCMRGIVNPNAARCRARLRNCLRRCRY
ncbi:MAG TPA: hypothetical protein VF666_00480 [Pyrinomonadaceae bacterium]|jgi:hypothetical protein